MNFSLNLWFTIHYWQTLKRRDHDEQNSLHYDWRQMSALDTNASAGGDQYNNLLHLVHSRNVLIPLKEQRFVRVNDIIILLYASMNFPLLNYQTLIIFNINGRLFSYKCMIFIRVQLSSYLIHR